MNSDYKNQNSTIEPSQFKIEEIDQENNENQLDQNEIKENAEINKKEEKEEEELVQNDFYKRLKAIDVPIKKHINENDFDLIAQNRRVTFCGVFEGPASPGKEHLREKRRSIMKKLSNRYIFHNLAMIQRMLGFQKEIV